MVLGARFMLNIILARLLSPSDYGVIGMLAIFMSISQCLVDSGFASALIQTKERSENDYGTVFIFNLFISAVLYGILFISAPGISKFYGMDILVPILRVLGLNLILGAFIIIQKTILTINLDFKKQSFISFPSIIVSGLTGIILAYLGFGVWALVAQTLSYSSLLALCYWLFSRTRFKLVFDSKSFRRLGGFGVKLMLSSLLHTFYKNLYGLLIGKHYSAKDLGYYSRADHFSSFPSGTTVGIISRVAYPVFCENQLDKAELSRLYSRFIKISCFIIFPMMIGLSVLSRPVMVVLLTEKWLPAAVLLSILCLNCLWFPINEINLKLLQAVGRSDLFLRLEIIKKTIFVGILLCTLKFGLVWICIGGQICSIIALLINMYYTGQILDKSYFQQIMDWLPNLLIAVLMGAVIAVTAHFISSPALQLIMGTAVGITAYLFLSSVFKLEAKELFFSNVQKYIGQIKK